MFDQHGEELRRRLTSLATEGGSAGGADAFAGRLDDVLRLLPRAAEAAANGGSQARRGQRSVPIRRWRGRSHLAGDLPLRPLCLILAARCGDADAEAVQQLAVAVELLDQATLFHEEVIDTEGPPRGGADNGLAVYCGDWLLVEALECVDRVGNGALMAELCDTIEEMIVAESVLLENRRRLVVEESIYFEVARGRTASVFRWALSAGAALAGLDEIRSDALRRFGGHFGLSVQLAEDLADLRGEQSPEELLADLRRGKMSFPLLLAARDDRGLRQAVEGFLTGEETAVPRAFWQRVQDGVTRNEADAACARAARAEARRARHELSLIDVVAGPAFGELVDAVAASIEGVDR